MFDKQTCVISVVRYPVEFTQCDCIPRLHHKGEIIVYNVYFLGKLYMSLNVSCLYLVAATEYP